MEVLSKNATTYSVRYETKLENGGTKTISVREVQNGFVISVCIYTPSTGSGDNYKESVYDDKEYISKTNPFMQEKEAPDLASIVQMCM